MKEDQPKQRGRDGFLASNPKFQDKICDGIRRGCTIQSIFEDLGISYRNYWVWLERGKKELRGVYREFYKAVEQAKVEHWESLKPTLERVVYKRATETCVAVNRKIERIMILSREDKMLLSEKYRESPELEERFKQDGIILKETTNVVQVLPNTTLATRILERKSPDEWGKKS